MLINKPSHQNMGWKLIGDYNYIAMVALTTPSRNLERNIPPRMPTTVTMVVMIPATIIMAAPEKNWFPVK